MNRSIRILLALILITFNFEASAQAPNATLLPLAVQQFFDNNGNPLSSGHVYFYIPNTSTLKTVWQDASEVTAWVNPVPLNASGRPNGDQAIYGSGSYRQILKDRNGNTIWDRVTASTGSSGGGGTLVGDGNLVGTVLPWSGLAAPNQYVFAYGQEIARATYPEFYTAITQQANVICTSTSNTLTGLSDTSQIRTGSPIELAACVVAGTTVVSKTSSTVVMSNASSVSINAVAIFFPWGNGNGTTTFNVPDFRGYVMAGRDNMGGTAASRLTTTYFGANTPDALGATGGSQSYTLLQANLPAFKPAITITDPGHTHTLTITSTATAGAGSVGGNVGSTTLTTNSNTTGITAALTNNLGSATPIPTVQPTITLNYVVKVTPDVSTSIATGVFSIGGMTGTIACAGGLICTGNVISVSLTGGGSINTGNASELAYYATAGSALSGLTSANNGVLVTDGSGVPSIGATIPTAVQANTTRTGTLVAGATGAGFTVALTTSTVTGTLTVPNGGTGATTFTANLPLIGAGAGAIASGTRSGNTTKFVTTTGTLNNGNCVSIDASGNFIDAGGVCTTGGGGGTVTAGTTSQLAYYVSSGTSVSGLATANNGTLITSGAGVPSISSTLPSAVQANITGTGTLTSGATGAGFTVALSTSTITGNLSVNRLNSGTSASTTTAWFGDGTWKSAVTSITCGVGLTGGAITTSGTCDLTVPVIASQGGTGATTLTPHGVVIGNGTGAVAITSAPAVGQCLVGNGASADPIFVGGCMVLLNTLTASSSASLSDTTSFTSTYSSYVLKFVDYLPANDAQSCEIQVQSSASFQTTGYKTIAFSAVSGSTANDLPTTFIPCSAIAGTGGVSNSIPLSGEIRVFNPAGTTAKKMWTGLLAYTNTSSGKAIMTNISGFWDTGTGAITGFKVLQSSGNIASGKIYVYGQL